MAPTMQAVSGPGKPGSWTITTQSQSVGPGANGRTVEGYKVGFVTGAGVQGSVFVPRDQYAPEMVKAAVAAHAADLDALQGSQG